MLAKLVADANNNLQRVHTRRDPKRCNLFDPKSAVEVTARKTRVMKDGTVKTILWFANGKTVNITYEEV